MKRTIKTVKVGNLKYAKLLLSKDDVNLSSYLLTLDELRRHYTEIRDILTEWHE